MSIPTAALLLDPKAYKRQNTTGNTSPFIHQLEHSCAMDSGQVLRIRHSSEPRISLPVASFSLPQKRQPIDDINLLEIIDTHTNFKGRSTPGSNNKPPDAQGPTSTGAPVGSSFDPKLLLGPRQYKFPTRPSPNTNNLHDSSNLSHGRNGVKIPTNTASGGADGGDLQPESNKSPAVAHGNMIEDIYGVERRENQPLKRIKVDNKSSTSNYDGPEARFSTSGTSALGSYMKEKPDDEGRTAVTTNNTIDLTADKDDKNDDDVIFVANKDRGAEEVCYGKIEGATVHAHIVPAPPKSVFSGTTADWPSIRCQLVRKRSQNITVEVRDVTGRSFGVLDTHVSTALAPLLDMTFDLRTQARLDVRRRRPNEWPGQACSELFRISINLYGPRRVADNIGRFLSQKNIWLGFPNAVEAGISTYNPHAERRRLMAVATQQQQPQQSTRYTVQSEVRTAEEISNAVTKMFDQLQGAQNLPEIDTPELLSTQLLPHQKQALGFMMEKEKPRKLGPDEADNNSLWRVEHKGNGQRIYREIISGVTLTTEPPQILGGLLADMMGLGKTLSILSLICSSLPEAAAWARKKSADSSMINAKTTLLVSPLSAVGNWVSQIKEHIKDDALSVYVFHGPNRTEDPKELAQYDIVITTYTTVLSDISGKSSKRKTSPLVQMNMFRIVLDEAHIIREQSAAQSQAIFQLNAQRRWSVTGTPIQNRLEDLGAVLKFLRLSPYDERGRFAAHIVSPFKCENPNAITNLRVLVDSFTLRRVKDRVNLPPRHDKTVMLTFSEPEKKLHDFFKKESNVMMNVVVSETREKTSGKMYHIVLKAMMVLRQICAHGKELLDKEDRERFRGLTANDAIDVEALDDDHSMTAASRKAYEMISLMKESSIDACVRCENFIALQSDDGPGDKNAMVAAILPCYDLLCADCFAPIAPKLDEMAGKPVQVSCAFCKSVIAPAYSVITTAGFEEYQASLLENKKNRKQSKEFGLYEGPHTKTKALISSLLDTAEENKKSPHEPPIKSVIFSSWTSHLDLIEVALEENGLTGYARLDGTMSLKQRNSAIETFSKDDDVTILLVTIGAGGVGLNLTAGSMVYIMEPQYNPATIAQAIDRVHRIGQTREVTTIQYIMKDSIEEKITELAKRKQRLADMSLNRKMDRREMQKERLEEYRSLFK
ncbi:putative 1-phosphatidylinositol 4-kinase [Microsporum canis]|uniref:Transcription termination factor 2 n=1 Tax=Arthroderma otae (strain ATCC MYA-4605 / CBS 113480) TaxID=554155 RepID=C5FPE4_ARTOC|nr:transcription termination factor 2 [Microsporum canis CBS 113480]EEQ31460.1 transcription termination factor 2 [Microsporum canis CBS 113480]